MNFKSFSELREFIRRYSSTSVLKIGAEKCWEKWETQNSNHLDWSFNNTERNYAVRIVLLASAGNPHRRKNISPQIFDNLINAYHNWEGHTISDERLLEEEVKILLSSILQWENDHQKEVRNWSLKLSNILDLDVIRANIASLFIQRLGAFQNAGYGSPNSRMKRTIKFIALLDDRSNNEFSDIFFDHIGLTPKNYFRQLLPCLSLFSQPSGKRGFCNLSQIPDIDNQLQDLGITPENLKLFIQKNSILFSEQTNPSFRHKIIKTLDIVPDYYQPIFYNYFLEVPFVKLKNEEFCLPDPFSFTESCWNQVRGLISKGTYENKLSHLLSSAFEDYLQNILFPIICPTFFEKIPEVEKPKSSQDKRADFLIRTPNSYIIIECKSCVMNSDTSSYFQAEKLAELWSRIHSASEQISTTVKFLNLCDKPVIPLILTFYDSIAASSVFEEMMKNTNYCSRMGLSMPPVVHSLHEFEHLIYNRSLNNWSELIIARHNDHSFVKPDNGGHNYKHLNDISI